MNQDRVLERIERAKAQLQVMIDLNPAGMMMVTADRRVVRANRAFIELVGQDSFQDAVNHPVNEVFGLDSLEPLAPVLDGEDDYGWCRLQVHLRGRSRTLEFSRVGGDEENHIVFVVVEDITDKLREDLEVEQAHKLMAVKQLLGAMMHHFNQPLTVIMLRANMLSAAVGKGQCTDEQILASLNEISDMAMRLSRLLSQLESRDRFETQNYYKGIDIMKIDAD